VPHLVSRFDRRYAFSDGTQILDDVNVSPMARCRTRQRLKGRKMKKTKLAAAATATATLAAILLSAPAASAGEVNCGDPNFVKVNYHTGGIGEGDTYWACFAGAGWNHFNGRTGYTSWMDYLETGNNDVTYRDCNGTLVDYRRGLNVHFSSGICISDIGIRPY
jgi:hypothetical protein